MVRWDYPDYQISLLPVFCNYIANLFKKRIALLNRLMKIKSYLKLFKSWQVQERREPIRDKDSWTIPLPINSRPNQSHNHLIQWYCSVAHFRMIKVEFDIIIILNRSESEWMNLRGRLYIGVECWCFFSYVTLVTLRFGLGQRRRLRVCVFVIGLKVYCGIDQFRVRGDLTLVK